MPRRRAATGRPRRARSAPPLRLGTKGWLLVLWGSLFVGYALVHAIGVGRLAGADVALLVAGVVILLLSPLPARIDGRRVHDPGWSRTSHHSPVTHFMDAEENEWETMRRRKEERRLRREERAREREARERRGGD